MDECIFCKIIEGKEKARKLYEDEWTISILDIAQVTFDNGSPIPGRSLIIPKRHVAWFYDLEDKEAGQLFIAAKIVAGKLKKAFNPDFVSMFIHGHQIAHAHIILQPSFKGDAVEGMFSSMRSSFKLATEEALNDIARKIQEI